MAILVSACRGLPISTLIHEGLFFFFLSCWRTRGPPSIAWQNGAQLVFECHMRSPAVAFASCATRVPEAAPAFPALMRQPGAPCRSTGACATEPLAHSSSDMSDVHIRRDDVARCVFLVLLSSGPLLCYAAKSSHPFAPPLRCSVAGTCVAGLATALSV